MARQRRFRVGAMGASVAPGSRRWPETGTNAAPISAAPTASTGSPRPRRDRVVIVRSIGRHVRPVGINSPDGGVRSATRAQWCRPELARFDFHHELLRQRKRRKLSKLPPRRTAPWRRPNGTFKQLTHAPERLLGGILVEARMIVNK